MRALGLLIISLLVSPFISYQGSAAIRQSTVYECPMHPEVQSSKPGSCPKCEMKLVAKKVTGNGKASPSDKSVPAGQSGAQPSREIIKQTDSYTCSMHPEIRSSSPGKCPKCGMTLIPVTPDLSEDFNLRMDYSPKPPKPNEKVRMRFSIFNPRTGEQVKSFQIMHDKLFHLFIVSQDMKEFQHIHPEFEPDGSFAIETVLPIAGQYKVYCDFYPTDGTPQVLQQNISTAGFIADLLASQPGLTPDTSLTKTLNGMKIELKIEPQEIIAGQPVTLKYHLTDATTGDAVRDLVPYLGAWGHTLILSEDQTDYVHSHPEETVAESAEQSKLRGGPDVTFGALVPRPGNYRIWTQFQRGDRLTTVSFTVHADRLR